MIDLKFRIKLDKELDEKTFLEFFNSNHPSIQKFFPQIKTEKDVFDALNYTYNNLGNDLQNTVDFLNYSKPILNQFSDIISEKIDYSWGGINEIEIVLCLCPICPRWIDENKFMVSYFYYKNDILRICAHEMTHFLYFKKLKDLLPSHQIDTEYPGLDWLLSEIVVLEITNSEKIQSIVHSEDELFVPDGMVSKEQIESISKLYKNEKDILKFRREAMLILKK